ncbi:CRISPR-associated protein Cas5/DevS, subtype MYXAN [Leptospira broomii serovar Hurstbridge str. 5399]|uniref:CRISPR-associated protein Cas5/DevS, subtype MYXAN n=1 Tax=Leptospira broomii serovar Hurstbridge str. 5399 TaxID=1049789 RepID=T0GBN0_9LEPT|nr:type I-MYXAN CRISPR-associated protein Cas5/Cmx5/DevS [Leptospira broomii]EQA44214.1 CRISPR-associated protein Cas5/DevS, subtype MYXAN [Leptospira broomii serovar Hurstbridge str. 5399]
MSDSICLYVSVPVACFRAPYARTYAETLPVPAPSTVYGMLLSLVGEREREKHSGVEIAIALLSKPERSTILRKMWRVKSVKLGPGLGNNATPDFQELLTGTELLIWVRNGKDINQTPLKERINNAFENPKGIRRFGSLCLGESTHLINDIRYAKDSDRKSFQLLKPTEIGEISLPIWPDHVGSFKTKWQQFLFEETLEYRDITDDEFISIHP